MTIHLLPKNGISVLVYSEADPKSRWLCSLSAKHSDTHMHATISLQSKIFIRGFDDEQTFTFLYDADNLVPNSNFLNPAMVSLPQAQLEKIIRQGNPQVRTLSLTTRKHCPINCPRGSIEPKEGFEYPFHQLTKLAGATTVHIVFDHNWIHRDNDAKFKHLICHVQDFTGFPVYNCPGRSLSDCTIFGSVVDAPPSYTESNKRSRQGEFRRT